MGRTSQGTGFSDLNGDGRLENADGTRGITIRGENGDRLLEATGESDGTGQQVFIPVDLLVDGETTEVEDVITGSVLVEDGNTVLLRANAVEDDQVEIDGDLVLTGEVQENQTL